MSALFFHQVFPVLPPLYAAHKSPTICWEMFIALAVILYLLFHLVSFCTNGLSPFAIFWFY